MIELNPNDGEPYRLLGLISFFSDDLVNSKVFYNKAFPKSNIGNKIYILNLIFYLNNGDKLFQIKKIKELSVNLILQK